MQVAAEFGFVKANKTNSTFEEVGEQAAGVVGIPSRPGLIFLRKWVLDEMAAALGHEPTRIRMILEPIE